MRFSQRFCTCILAPNVMEKLEAEICCRTRVGDSFLHLMLVWVRLLLHVAAPSRATGSKKYWNMKYLETVVAYTFVVG